MLALLVCATMLCGCARRAKPPSPEPEPAAVAPEPGPEPKYDYPQVTSTLHVVDAAPARTDHVDATGHLFVMDGPGDMYIAKLPGDLRKIGNAAVIVRGEVSKGVQGEAWVSPDGKRWLIFADIASDVDWFLYDGSRLRWLQDYLNETCGGEGVGLEWADARSLAIFLPWAEGSEPGSGSGCTNRLRTVSVPSLRLVREVKFDMGGLCAHCWPSPSYDLLLCGVRKRPGEDEGRFELWSRDGNSLGGFEGGIGMGDDAVTWQDDGRTFLFRNAPDTYQVYDARARLVEERRFPVAGDVKRSWLSPDGQHLIVRDGKGMAWLSGAGEAVPMLPEEVTCDRVEWSLDSVRACLRGSSTDAEQRCYVYDVAANRLTLIGPDMKCTIPHADPNASRPSPSLWTPDGTRLAVIGTGEGGVPHLIVVDSARRQATDLTPNLAGKRADFHGWTSDGECLFYEYVRGPNSRDLRVISADGSAERVLLASKAQTLAARYEP